MKQTTRTFVAVETSPAVRDRTQKLIDRLRATPANVKWVERQNLHITLKFLGDVALNETARVCQAVAKAAENVSPFDLEICGAGAFPNPGRPRTVWLGASQGEEAMRALHKHVESALAKLGFRKDNRAFRTHLTIGRVRRGGIGLAELGQLIRQHADFLAGRTPVAEVIVFASHLGPSGPTYEALGRAKLCG